MTVIDKRKLYALPWNLYDSPVGRVEITNECNMTCKGCYRNVIAVEGGHKSFEDIKKEILFLKKERNVSEISIAGGEPLLHPDIINILRFISLKELAPKIFTNGKDLTQDFLHELVVAGLNHITFHVDSGQVRNNEWDNNNEVELNGLRQHYVDLCQKEERLGFSFILMITKKNSDYIPQIIQWALNNKGKAKSLIFIAIRCYRNEMNGAKPRMINIDLHENVTSVDIYDAIKKNYPSYDVSAYLGSTVDAKSFKLLLSTSVCSGNELVGSIGPVSVELYLLLRHLIYGRYVTDGKNVNFATRNIINLICFLFDRKLHRILLDLFRFSRLFQRSLYLLRVTIKQGNDISSFGDMEMCDGCPEMTYFQGRLVNQCRLDEFRRYGKLITDFGIEEQ